MSLAALAKHVARQLKERQLRVVLAESCTGGMVAATLARQPGISNWLCGSAVTYRNDTKHRWLGVSADSLDSPGPVSAIVAEQMVEGALAATPEADVACAVTGHLGPNAPPAQDGVIFVAVASRPGQHRRIPTETDRCLLRSQTRPARQREAAERVLARLLMLLSGTATVEPPRT